MKDGVMIMEMNIIFVAVMSCIGYLCGVIFMHIGGRYYEDRFGRQWTKSRIAAVLWPLLLAFSSGVFTIYGYGITAILALDIFIAALFVIAVIDGREQIIPNVILIGMFVARTVLYLIELLVGNEMAIHNIKQGLVGFGVFAVMLGGVKLICKNRLGMGDVKMLMIAGYFLGLYRCCLVFFLALVIAVIHIVIRMIMRKMSVKDGVSFGPYIAIGGYIALTIGIY